MASHTTSLAIKTQNLRFLGGICIRKPLFFARLLYGFFMARVLKQKRLRFMDIAVDYACNMRCVHCSAASLSDPGTPKLTLQDYATLARMLRAQGCLIFHFTGGEPLLRKDLEEIIKAFKPSMCSISIQSNGLLVTRERLRSLRRAGVDIFNVSIDSGIPEEHDAFRRTPGAFAKAVEAVKMAMQEGFCVTISTCISHANLGSQGLRDIIDMTRQLGIWCYFNLAVPAGNWRECTDFMITEEDMKAWRKIVAENPHCRIDLCSNWYVTGCGTIKEKAYLTAYGDIMPCPFIQVSLGNLKNETMSEIRARAARVPEFADYWPCCLAAEEKAFIEKMPCYAGIQQRLPVHYSAIPWMKEHMERTTGK